MSSRHPIVDRARQLSLLRLLLVALALAVVVFAAEARQVKLAPDSVAFTRWLLVGIGVSAGLLAALVSWTRYTWQLILHLVFDLLWVGTLIYLTGGVASPAMVLLFAVVVMANLVLPGLYPLVIPSLGSLVVAANAALYLGRSTPFPQEFVDAYPQLMETKRILGYLAVQVGALFIVDVLAQVLTKRLREQRFFTEELLDQLGEGVIAIDRSGILIYANDEALRLLGLPASGRGQLAANALRSIPQLLALALDTQPRLERMESPGERRLVLRATNLHDHRERLMGRCLLIADETRLHLLEEHARRADHLRSLGEMAAGIAHEVRNPLTSLRGCAQELADICRRGEQPDAVELARIVVDESDRLERIVRDFLALSRLREPQREPLDLEHLLDQIATLVRARNDLPPALTLTCTIDDDTPSVLADGDQLKQVLLNLAANSIDALHQRQAPRLVITAAPAEKSNPLAMPAVTLIIEDNGCGIPRNLHEQIFTPFFSTKAQGTGLGLSLVNRIVREHEGLMSLTSTPDVGTVITIYLPAHSATRTFRRALGQR